MIPWISHLPLIINPRSELFYFWCRLSMNFGFTFCVNYVLITLAFHVICLRTDLFGTTTFIKLLCISRPWFKMWPRPRKCCFFFPTTLIIHYLNVGFTLYAILVTISVSSIPSMCEATLFPSKALFYATFWHPFCLPSIWVPSKFWFVEDSTVLSA